jgi:hypothetical protein
MSDLSPSHPQDSTPAPAAVCACGHPVSTHGFYGCLTGGCSCRLDETAALAARVAELEAALATPAAQRIELLEAALKAIRKNLGRSRTVGQDRDKLVADAEELARVVLEGGAS